MFKFNVYHLSLHFLNYLINIKIKIIPSNNISVIVFDLGNVLLPFDYNIAIKKLNNIETGLGEKFISYYNNNYDFHRAFEKDEICEKDFIDKLLNVLNNKLKAEQFKIIFSSVFKENKYVSALLPKLKEKYKLVLLSNTNSIHKEYGWKDYDFLKYFDKLILSHEVQSVKPEEKIYKCVEDFTQLPPNSHLFIDDIEEYAEAAKKLGWDAIQFVGYENLVEELTIRKIL